jgi:hypothetical protein
MSDPSVLRLLMRMSTILEPDESMGEDARSIAYFDMYVFPTNATSSFPRMFLFSSPPKRKIDGHRQTLFCCRILQREGERDLFALRQPAMTSDDDSEEGGSDIELDASDETREVVAERRSGSTSELQSTPCFNYFMSHAWTHLHLSRRH